MLEFFTRWIGVLPLLWQGQNVLMLLPWFQRYKITNSIEIKTRNAEKIAIRSPFFMFFLVRYQ